MPAWWGRKSSKSKEEQEKTLQHKNPYSNRNNNNFIIKSSINSDIKKKDKGVRPKSFDEQITRGSPRASKELVGAGVSASGFSGFDSDGCERRQGHPLPRPSVSSAQGLGNDQVLGLGSGYASVSSVSSSGSSEDQPIAHDSHAQFGASSYRLVTPQTLLFRLGLLLFSVQFGTCALFFIQFNSIHLISFL